MASPIRLGSHELLIRLASGGAANVFLVRDLATSADSRLLALKILLPSLASNEDFLKMFFTEAKIASGLRHPNVVAITGFGQVEGIHCLAMEFVFGSSLAQVLRASARAKKPLTVGVLLRITAQVCDALHYAHELRDDSNGQPLGLVHRDVTPQNILIGFNGIPKLTDFGIAKATNRGWETQAGIVKGKFSYMSPEQALGKKVDRRSDIFGTGIVLWEALTGRDLFKGSTPMEVLAAIREQKIEPPSKVVPGLTPIVDPIVMKALKRSPRSRYQTAAEMRDDIENLIQRAGVEIDAQTISQEFAAIYGDDIVERAFALRAAMAGKGDVEQLAKVLGGHVLEQKHLPQIKGGITDPDPLGLFSNQQPVLPEDRSIEDALPARLEESFGGASVGPSFDDVSEFAEHLSPEEEEEEVAGFDVVEGTRPELEDFVPPERMVSGWEENTAMGPVPDDDLLSMISEEDATIGFLPPEFAERFGKELKQALEDGAPDFEDELTVGVPNGIGGQIRSINTEDDSLVGGWDDLYEENPMGGSAQTEAVSNRPVPQAPSLFLNLDTDRRPSPVLGTNVFDRDKSPSPSSSAYPRAPSLDMEETNPVPDVQETAFDLAGDVPMPRAFPPPANRSDSIPIEEAISFDDSSSADDSPPMLESGALLMMEGGKDALLDSSDPKFDDTRHQPMDLEMMNTPPDSGMPEAVGPPSEPPDLDRVADALKIDYDNTARTPAPRLASQDPLSPDALRALAEGAEAQEEELPVVQPQSLSGSSSIAPPSTWPASSAIQNPEGSKGVRLSPTMLIIATLILLGMGAVIGILVTRT